MGLGLSGFSLMMVVMLAGCGVIVGSDRLWVCEREGQRGRE